MGRYKMKLNLLCDHREQVIGSTYPVDDKIELTGTFSFVFAIRVGLIWLDL